MASTSSSSRPLTLLARGHKGAPVYLGRRTLRQQIAPSAVQGNAYAMGDFPTWILLSLCVATGQVTFILSLEHAHS